MRPLKLIGIGIIILAGIGGVIAAFILSQDINNVSGWPFMVAAGFSMVMLVCGIAIIWMSRKNQDDPFEEASKAILEDAEAKGERVRKDGQPANSAIPMASLSVIEQLMENNAILKANNKKLQSIIDLEQERDSTLHEAESARSEEKTELTFEEELEQGKKAYYESLKEKPVQQPLAIQEANDLARRMQNIQITPPPQEMIDRYNQAIREAYAEKAEREAPGQKDLPPFKAAPSASKKPEKVKVKFEWPFGKKKATGLRAILDEEEAKMKKEEEWSKGKHGI